MADITNRELFDAALDEDRRRSIELIHEGADPFHKIGHATAFHVASFRDDLDLMLQMAAEPGSPWEQRFLLSRGRIVNVPVHSRESIRLLSSRRENLFPSARSVSMAGLEIMLMYGYTLKQGDFDIVAYGALEEERHLPLFKFCVAAGLFRARAADTSFKLDRCLICVIHGRAQSAELARIVLNAGCDPNCSIRSYPLLYYAVTYGYENMAKLLVAYGADLSVFVRETDWVENEDGERIEQIGPETSICSLASERGMLTTLEAEPLLPPVNVDTYVEELRRDFDRPLKIAVKDYSSLLVVAMMRSTGQVPPVGIFSEAILSYCPHGFDLWKVN